MASSSVDSARTTESAAVTTQSNRSTANFRANDYRRRYPQANNYNNRRRDGRAGASRGAGAGAGAGHIGGSGGHTFGRRNQIPNRKQMMSLDECKHLLNIAPGRSHHGRIKMEGAIMECDICCRESDLFAIGECLHPLCMECGIRLRILSKTDSCPKCRATIETMYFIPFEGGDWSNVSVPPATDCVENPSCDRYKIKFRNEYCVKCFDSYMEHACLICEKKGERRVFATFAALRQHVWMVHRFDYCEICVEHLNLLSRERRFYSQLELEQHMQTGDTDDRSQKGHPLCLFCEKRFLDDEYRYKHLRKEHFFCQICDADGKLNYFYPQHKDLLHHYKKEHVICEEGDCKQLGIAFRTETELKLHKSRDHAAGPQTLDVDIHFTDRSFGGGISRGGGGGAPSSSHHRGGRGGGSGQGRGGTASAGHLPGSQRNIPRIGVVPSEQPKAPPRAPDDVDVVIVPSAQNRPVAPSLRYSCAPAFTITGNDFPRLGSAAGPAGGGGAGASNTTQGGSSSSTRSTRYPNLGPMGGGVGSSSSGTSRSATGLTSELCNESSTTTSSNKNGQLSSRSSARQEQIQTPATKLSWFIDDDEQMPPHRPNPAALVNANTDRGSEEDGKDSRMFDHEKNAQPSEGAVHEEKLETSWGGAVIRRPNSLSSIASALNSNAFPSLSSSGNVAQPSSTRPKNLLPNSAWARNRLQFTQSSSVISGAYVPSSERGGSASAAKKKVLPKPDIWPVDSVVPTSWEERDMSEGTDSLVQLQENLKPIGKMAKKEVTDGVDDQEHVVTGGGKKKKGKKEKAKQQAQHQMKSKQDVKEVAKKEGQEASSREIQSAEKPKQPTSSRVGKITASASKVDAGKSEAEPFPALNGTADTTKQSDRTGDSLSEGMKKAGERVVAVKESPVATDISATPVTSATTATSFSQMLSNAFSSLMGASVVGGGNGTKIVSSEEKGRQSSKVVNELRKNASRKKKSSVEQDKIIDEVDEDFPSLSGGNDAGSDKLATVAGKSATDASAVESSAWTRGAPELSSTSTKSTTGSRRSMKGELSTGAETKSNGISLVNANASSKIAQQSSALSRPSATPTSFVLLPPGLDIGKGGTSSGGGGGSSGSAPAVSASGVRLAPPGLAPPPGFGPPPGFEAAFASAKKATSPVVSSSSSSATTITVASTQKPKNSWKTVPKKGKN